MLWRGVGKGRVSWLSVDRPFPFVSLFFVVFIYFVCAVAPIARVAVQDPLLAYYESDHFARLRNPSHRHHPIILLPT